MLKGSLVVHFDSVLIIYSCVIDRPPYTCWHEAIAIAYYYLVWHYVWLSGSHSESLMWL